MKRILLSVMLAMVSLCGIMAQESYSGTVVADEGAWCWFADPRALHYENTAGTINATYIGYIDVHGNVKATQYDWINRRKTDVLIRSYFQPDDHNNPTFVVLPDERVMIFYTRHTDEPKIWYRISQKPGDITALGEEKFLTTANNTTYPSPFILSDDPNHIYLCWRGIDWHPTIARLTMPDANDDCQFDFGPKQIVKTTAARPYAKYQSNGKDKIYVSYTTGHPDNEMPNWLYFNVIDINNGNGPILRDLKGNQLSVIANGVFNVNKTDAYASQYPATIVDKTANIRNWVWQITLDKDENPVVAYPHIDDAKKSHVYWYARWNGSEWKNTWVQYGGHAFHQNWNSTEMCYSGGMSIDPENINDLYLSIPTTNGAYNKDGVYEIWKYTIDDDGKVAGSKQITRNSSKNNVRPFIIPGSKDSEMRLAWMNGDYYYWIVKKGYPKGYPTGIRCDYAWEEKLTDIVEPDCDCLYFGKDKTLNLGFAMNASKYEGILFSLKGEDDKELVYSIDASDKRPVITINGKKYKGSNCLLTSDDWANKSDGTSGDNHPTNLTTWVLTLTYDGTTLTTYRNGLVDQVIETDEVPEGDVNVEGEMGNDDTFIPYNHTCLTAATYDVCCSPITVQSLVKYSEEIIEAGLADAVLKAINLPDETRTDLVLPTNVLGQTVTWTSSDETVMTATGVLVSLKEDADVTLTATVGNKNKTFEVKALARDIAQNLIYSKDDIDLTSNTASGFNTNKYEVAPEGLLSGLRSFTFLLTVNAKSLTKTPRLYDFGSASSNSLFLRANPLSAGVKYNGGTTTMVNSNTTLSVNKEYKLAVSYDAGTKTTKIYIDGVENAAGTANQIEAYQLEELAKDVRNYIGRTQWWDTDVKADNVDFVGYIDGFRMYNVCLTRKEICELQSITYVEKELPTALVNGDFEGSYKKMTPSVVSSDRAIYVPQGWTVDHVTPNENDITALKSGDFYYSIFFENKPTPSKDSKQTYWVRQNWGTSTILLSQEIRLKEGEYTLEADLWKSGLGGDATISVIIENGATIKSPSFDSKEEWQKVSLDFNSDGSGSTTIQLAAIHTANGSEKIIGFDNVKITRNTSDEPNDIKQMSVSEIGSDAIYNLAGQKVSSPTSKGVYISGGKKIIVQ
ncbi:MAG: BNR-4 repeat-containing protein [Prevotellaceae bacterium]|nr:BNR-4 repeat-containing protein [Prevotellaceae bacterium]